MVPSSDVGIVIFVAGGLLVTCGLTLVAYRLVFRLSASSNDKDDEAEDSLQRHLDSFEHLAQEIERLKTYTEQLTKRMDSLSNEEVDADIDGILSDDKEKARLYEEIGYSNGDHDRDYLLVRKLYRFFVGQTPFVLQPKTDGVGNAVVRHVTAEVVVDGNIVEGRDDQTDGTEVALHTEPNSRQKVAELKEELVRYDKLFQKFLKKIGPHTDRLRVYLGLPPEASQFCVFSKASLTTAALWKKKVSEDSDSIEAIDEKLKDELSRKRE